MDNSDPLTPSIAYTKMESRWRLMRDLLGGTETMKAAGELYLPRHEAETHRAYQRRLDAAVLFNYVEKALDTLSGMPFGEPLTFSSDTPTEIVENIAPDIDLCGNSLNIFAANWFKEGFAKAFCHVLIDYPRTEGTERTLADDRADNSRPYWVLLSPESVLDIRTNTMGGVEYVTHCRIIENYTEYDGFTEIQRQRVKIYTPGLVQVLEPDGKNEKWHVTDEWQTTLGYVPLVTFYSAKKNGTMDAKPPLLDLAYMCRSHWCGYADQKHSLTVARFPILACSGASAADSDPVIISPNKVLYNPDPAGRFYYVEHRGAAIEAGRKDLEDLQTVMASYGVEFLKTKTGNSTATARALDSAEATSDLQAMVLTFEDSLKQAIDITADWMGIENEGKVSVYKRFGIKDLSQDGLKLLSSLRERRDISRETMLEAVKIGGVLPPEFNADDDAEKLEEEAAMLTGKSSIDIDEAGE